jgi:hypothetical protein
MTTNKLCNVSVGCVQCNSAGDCSSGNACDSNACSTTCFTTSLCNGGCCSIPSGSSGTCETGDTAAACGVGGQCTDCTASNAGHLCLTGGTTHCGCNGNGDCPAGQPTCDTTTTHLCCSVNSFSPATTGMSQPVTVSAGDVVTGAASDPAVQIQVMLPGTTTATGTSSVTATALGSGTGHVVYGTAAGAYTATVTVCGP